MGTVSNQRGAGPSKGPSAKTGNVVPGGRKGGGRCIIYSMVRRHCPNKDRNVEWRARGEREGRGAGGKEGVESVGPD